MAVEFMDGFDQYAPLTGASAPTLNDTSTPLGAYYTYSGSATTVYFSSPLNSIGGWAITVQGAGLIQKTLPSGTLSRVIVGCRIKSDRGGTSCGISFVESSTFQASVSINSTDGSISVRNGSLTGTVLSSYAAGITSNSTHYLEIDIAFSNSASYTVKLDGTTVISGTGDTTGNANNYITAIRLNSSGSTCVFTVDDLRVFNTTGSTNNALTGLQEVIETSWASADSQKQFSASQVVMIGANSKYSTTNTAPGANQLVLRQFVAPTTFTLDNVYVKVAATSAGAKFKPVVYPDSGGSPNSQTLTAVGSETVGCTSGSDLTLSFASGPSLTGGSTYWIGYITDTSVAVYYDNAGNLAVSAANTYTSGAPDPCPTVTTGKVSWSVWGTGSGGSDNYVSTDNSSGQAPITTTAYAPYIGSATASDEDLYTFDNMANVPDAVYAVAVWGMLSKSDGGTRTADFRLKSSATTDSGSKAGITPGTTPAAYQTIYETDPNGSITWTGSAVNAATIGAKVAT